MPQEKNIVGLEEVIQVVKRVRTGGLLGPSEGKSWARLSHKRCGESAQEAAHQTTTTGVPTLPSLVGDLGQVALPL